MAGFGQHGFGNDDFDKQFEQTVKTVQKNAKRGFKFVLVAWAVNALVGLTVLGGIGYVVVHFIKKLW